MITVLHARSLDRKTSVFDYPAMTLCGVFIIVHVLAWIPVQGKISSEYILRVNPVCSTDRVEDASIHIVTDIHVQAKASCADGNYHTFTTVDDVHHHLTVSYPGQGDSSCVFHKRQNADVYVVRVVVSQGEVGRLVHQVQEQYTVTCTYSSQGMNGTATHVVTDGYLSPLEIQTNVGGQSTTNMELKLADVLGGDLTGTTLNIGKTVWLLAHSTGEAGEVGVTPVSCDAVGVTTNQTYPILRAGCGDGEVFGKNQGFMTKGLKVTSPYFKVFNVNSDHALRFRCNFTLCSTNCDGSSCVNARKRRRVDMNAFIMEESLPLHVVKTKHIINNYRAARQTMLGQS